ncbi:MAG: diguanylate cyclase [Myxococcales bacterium]|nr:diguanylate cyclase [Myxococcales bacterium]
MLLGFKLRRLLWRARRITVDLWGAATTVGAATLVAIGWFPDLRSSSADIAPIVAACALGALVVVKVAGRLRIVPSAEREVVALEKEDRRDLKSDLELGAALVVATYVTLELSGGLFSPVYPLVYALTAFIVTFHRRLVGIPLVFVTLAMEGLLCRAAVQHGMPEVRAREQMISHATFIGFFALTHFVFLQSEVLRQRREHRAVLARAIRSLRDEARDFRLISSSLSADPKARSRESDEERLAIGAVQAIHDTIFYTVDLLKKSLDLNTCVLLWLDDTGARLKIKELVTDSDCVVETAINADAGALGTVVKNRLLVNLRDPKRGHLPYYAAPVEVSFLGVPVIEDGHLRGVLCADRGGDRPFSEKEEKLLQGAAEQMLRAIQSERVFAQVERAKYEHERFFAALARLNRALTAEDVYATTFEATREICEFDLAAITLFDKASKRHTVVSTVGDAPKGLSGLSFGDNAGIAAMVVKNKHFLPAGGEVRDKDALIFTKKVRLEGMESLLVLPLICREEAVGSFAVAAKRARAFGKDKREMLTVIASHVAVKLTNAQLYGRMEEMATTDGLTGLSNHRTFQERFAEMLARAERTGGKQALLLTDIDHFKKVNDNYGHPIGDVVLRGVAQVVRDCVRKVDLAARYGGEEFGIVLEGTDLAGARQLAERIRSEVEKQVFQSPKGPFGCTLSLGIAVYPDDGRDGKTIIDHADQSLYHAKHNGRNRAFAFPDLAGVKLKAVK